MKTAIIIYLLSCLICSVGNSQHKNEIPDDQKFEEEDLKSEEIPWLEARKDIYNLLGHTNTGLRELRGYALGGEFCVEHFFTASPSDPKNDTVQGVLMWYCLNKKAQIPGYQNFILAAEQMEKHQALKLYEDKALEPDRPLNRPLATYRYTENGTNLTSIGNYINRPMGSIYCGPPAISDPANHRQLVAEYDTFLKEHPRVGRTRFNETNWAYFQNNYDERVKKGVLTHLITQQQGIKHIRYYFGYNEGRTRRNTIRVLLFAVDGNGKNITTYVVQKSIPPAKNKDREK